MPKQKDTQKSADVIQFPAHRARFEHPEDDNEELPNGLHLVETKPRRALKDKVADYASSPRPGEHRNIGDRKGDYAILGTMVAAVLALTLATGNKGLESKRSAIPTPKVMEVKPGEGISDVVLRAHPGIDQETIDAETNEIKSELHGNVVLHPGQKIKVDIED